MKEIWRLIEEVSVELPPEEIWQMATKITEISGYFNTEAIQEAIRETPGEWKIIKRGRGFRYQQRRDPYSPFVFEVHLPRRNQEGIIAKVCKIAAFPGGRYSYLRLFKVPGVVHRVEIKYGEDDDFHPRKEPGVVFTLRDKKGEKMGKTGVVEDGLSFFWVRNLEL